MKETPTHLGHVLKVVVSLLQGSSSVQRLPHARVLAEEGLTVVLDPVHHLGEEEEEGAEEEKDTTFTVRATVAEELCLLEKMHSDLQPSELFS